LRLEALINLLGSLITNILGLVPSHVKREVNLLANAGLDNHFDVRQDELPNLSLRQSCLSLVEADLHSPDGVLASSHDSMVGTIEEVPCPRHQMVAGFQQHPTPVTFGNALDDTPVHVGVLSRSHRMDGNYDQAEEEDRLIHTLHSHEGMRLARYLGSK
jgi:hypothetical protein